MNTNTHIPPEHRLAAKLESSVMQHVDRVTVGLFKADLAAVERIGSIYLSKSEPLPSLATGVLYSPDGKSGFLITANHVVTDFCQPESRMQIVFGSEERPLPFMLNDGLVTDQENDVAVFKLTEEQTRYIIKSGAEFLNDKGIVLEPALEDWQCLISGLLADGTRFAPDRQTILCHRYSYWTVQSHQKLKSGSYIPSNHLLLSHTRHAISPKTMSLTRSPKILNGLSGAAVWRVFHERHLSEPWEVNSLQSVGIQTHEYDDCETIQCTKWNCIMPLIAQLLQV